MKKLFLLTIVCLPFCIFWAGRVCGAVFCVDPGGGGNYTNLQSALGAAEFNEESDVILVVQGTYTGNYTYSSTKGYNITVLGGYTAGCAARVFNPANTILDGTGSGRVVDFYDSHGGTIQLDNFTIQNGSSTGDGGGVYAVSSLDTGTAGNVILSNNIINDNTSTQGGGGAYVRSYSTHGTAGNVTLYNNIITENSANVGGGVFASSYSVDGTPGQGTITNNTIADNTATNYGGGALLYAYNGLPGGILNVYNNIIWGNTSPVGADIDLTNITSGTTNGYNNNYATMHGSWDNAGENINTDPLFVGGGNYHLSSGSPCFGAGTNGAPSIPSIDFEGDNRTIGTVDIGADEYNCSNDPFKIGDTIASYPSIHAAYTSMSNGTMQIHSAEFAENLLLDLNKIVTMAGGYGCAFASNPGFTRINGSMTITNGCVTIEKITIK
jgi:hypothetical protein